MTTLSVEDHSDDLWRNLKTTPSTLLDRQLERGLQLSTVNGSPPAWVRLSWRGFARGIPLRWRSAGERCALSNRPLAGTNPSRDSGSRFAFLPPGRRRLPRWENGWDYLCDMVRAQAPLPVLRRKFGIATGALQPVRHMMEMRADEPTRPRPDEQPLSFHVPPVLVLALFGAYAVARVRSELGGGEISTRRMARLLADRKSHEP